jgi:hypothetical protein
VAENAEPDLWASDWGGSLREPGKAEIELVGLIEKLFSIKSREISLYFSLL